MAGYRDLFMYSMRGMAKGLSTKSLLNLTGQRLILPVYHTVSNYQLPHIQHLYRIKNVDEFRQDLEYLLKYFEPLSYEDLSKYESNRNAKRPGFILSFDDGLSEFYDVIAPILLEKGIPAINFLNSDFVDNKDLFFRYKVSLLIEAFENHPEYLQHSEVQEWLGGTEDSISKVLLKIRYDRRDELDQLADWINFDFGSFLEKKKPYLNSTQIFELIEKGFHFGAHSKSHPEYRFIPLEEQINQTKESSDWVQQKFNLNYKLFAFPFTDYQVSRKFFDNLTQANVTDYTFGVAGQKKDEIKNHFHRIPFEMNQLSAREIINTELIYYLFKQPFGKNLLRRT